MLVARRRARSRSASTASATRAARPTWTGSRTTASGFNYRLSDLAAAIGVAQLERLDEMLDARSVARRRELLPRSRARGRSKALERCPCEDEGDERRSWFVYVRAAPGGVDRDAVIAALARARHRLQGLPALHPPAAALPRALRLRGGEFPVAEGVAERSLALPFFTSMTESQVDRVCTALGEALGIATLDSARHVAASREEQDPLFRRINSSISFDWRAGAVRRRAVEGPRPGAARRLGVLDDDELAQITGPRPGPSGELERGTSSSATTTRTSTWRSSAGSPS